MQPRKFAFDFDGVIAQYDGYKGDEVVGEPKEEVVEAIRLLKHHGHTIIVTSTRREDVLKRYFEKYKIPVDYINEDPDLKEKQSKPRAHVYIDDRAYCYTGQSAEQLVKDLNTFVAYWEKE